MKGLAPEATASRKNNWMLFLNPATFAVFIFLTFAICIFLTFFGCGSSGESISFQVSKTLKRNLENHVRKLAIDIGERNPNHPEKLRRAAEYIISKVAYPTNRFQIQTYLVNNRSYSNLIFKIPGKKPTAPLVIIGAHYDSARSTPGADDNASGTAALIEIARLLKKSRPESPVEIVFFTLEEPPHFRTPTMGSTVYATAIRAKNQKVKIMISLEMLGYFSSRRIQRYPLFFMRFMYPATGDFVAVVGTGDYAKITEEFYSRLQLRLRFNTELLIAPAALTGVDFSDHLSFWKYKYPALMVTDTAFYRNKQYHKKSDLPATLNYRYLAELTRALSLVISDISRIR